MANGNDGFTVQMALADIAEAKNDFVGMKAALEAAAKLDPSQSEPIQALVDLAKKQDEPDDGAGRSAQAVLARRARRPRVYRRLMRALLDRSCTRKPRTSAKWRCGPR